eukprot:6200070-Pleurochrysis_carterae.AAC.2
MAMRPSAIRDTPSCWRAHSTGHAHDKKCKRVNKCIQAKLRRYCQQIPTEIDCAALQVNAHNVSRKRLRWILLTRTRGALVRVRRKHLKRNLLDAALQVTRQLLRTEAEISANKLGRVGNAKQFARGSSYSASANSRADYGLCVNSRTGTQPLREGVLVC